MNQGKLREILFSILGVTVVFWPLGALYSYVLLVFIGFYYLRTERRINWETFIFAPFFFLILLCSIAKGNIYQEIDLVSKILMFSLCPFVLVGMSKKELMIGLKCFLISIVITDLYSIFRLLHFFNNSNYEFTTSNFGHLNEAIGFERPYIGFKNAIAFSILLFWNKRVMWEWFRWSALVITGGYIALVSARLGLGLIFISIFLYVVSQIRSFKWILLSMVSLIVLTLVIIFNVPSLKDRFGGLNKDPRILIWSNAMKVVESPRYNFLWGNPSIGQKDIIEITTHGIVNEMNEPLWKDFYEERRFNSHNQYLFLFLYGGLLLVSSLIIPLLYIGWKSMGSEPFFIFSLLSVCLFFLVENVLERELGTIFIGIILSSLVNYKPIEKKS